MQSPLKCLFFLLSLPAIALAVTSIDLAPAIYLEPTFHSLAIRQDDPDLGGLISGLLGSIGPIFDLLKPQTFEYLQTILRNAAILLSDENTQILTGLLGLLTEILSPELLKILEDLTPVIKALVGAIGPLLRGLMGSLLGGGGGGESFSPNGTETSGGGDGGGSDGPGGFDWSSLGGGEGGTDGEGGKDNDNGGSGTGGGENDGSSDAPGTGEGGEGNGGSSFQGVGPRSDPVTAAILALFVSLGIVLAV